MSKNKKTKGKSQPSGPKITMVSENRRARHKYEILESVECGMQLLGSEVKVMREGRLSLDEAYGRLKDGDLWLIGADIPHYKNAGLWNHDPARPRKLLLHKRELAKFAGRASERGLTLVPLKVYFNERGLAKCEMALARGKKIYDKRETLKKRDTDRGLARAMRRG